MSGRETTCVCVLTPSGRGAVAVVAVEGSAAVAAVDRYFQAANGRNLDKQPLGRILYGHWSDSQGEDLVVCRRADESLEIHCHGGRQSSAQIVADLVNAGCTQIDADAWLTCQQECPLTAAAHLVMSQATTLRAATILLDQYHGALQREIEAIVVDLKGADLEKENAAGAIARLESLLHHAEFGKHLTEPWRVVIAGQPNVGKSSLINALVGYERAIVFDQPGTTRDVVSAATAIEGWPVELSDTAGLHETDDQIETAGISLARERLAAADLVVWVLGAEESGSCYENASMGLAREQAEAVGVRLDVTQTLVVLNKIDLADFTVDKKSPSIGTCAVEGTGIAELLSAIATRLVPNAPSPGAAIPFAPEQVEAVQASLSAARRQEFRLAIEALLQLVPGFAQS